MKCLSRAAVTFVLLNRWLIGVLMGVMAVLVMANVISRYGFNTSLGWTEELSRFLMIAVTYLGAGLALREGRLIAVDAVQELFPAAKYWIRIFVGVAIIVFMLALTWIGYQYAIFADGQETPVLGISAVYPYLIIPAGALAVVMHLLLFFTDFVDQRWDAAPAADDVEQP